MDLKMVEDSSDTSYLKLTDKLIEAHFCYNLVFLKEKMSL